MSAEYRASFRPGWAVAWVGVALAACASSEKPGPAEPAPSQPGPAGSSATSTPGTTDIDATFDDAQIREHAGTLMSELSISGTQRVQLEERLDAFLAHPEVVEAKEKLGVQAVGVYRWGEGGLVVKLLKGDGTLHIAGDDAQHRFELKATSIGAQVGGSASWGILLALGLPNTQKLSGTYRGSVTTATAAEENAGTFRMLHKQTGHTVYFVGIATGLSANAAESKLVLAVLD